VGEGDDRHHQCDTWKDSDWMLDRQDDIGATKTHDEETGTNCQSEINPPDHRIEL
jgi:hypothetical protein